MTAQIIQFPSAKRGVATVQTEAALEVPEVGADFDLPFCFFVMYLQYFKVSPDPKHQAMHKKLQTAFRRGWAGICRS